MPHIPNTPEAILPRSDSRNPAVTCRGITTNGRPCRRALASSNSPSPASSPAKGGKNAQVSEPSALFCWQHKDQAVSYASGKSSGGETVQNPRSSIDTVMDRLGILDINDKQHQTAKPKRDARPPQRRTRRTFCCFEIVDEQGEEDEKPSKPKPIQTPPARRTQQTVHNGASQTPSPHLKPPGPSQGNIQNRKRNSSRPQPSTLQRNRNSSQTQALLSWIPPSVCPQTTSALLTELAKPIAAADEAGYIYMFWVTPSAPSPPPREVATSLFPPSQRPNNTRSVSDAIRAADDLNALTSKPSSSKPGTVRLKIGRTSNVQRRLNEWTRQCSHNLTLIRYYPYTPSSPASSPRRNGVLLEQGRKVPHVHRVEKLIHIELRDIRVRDIGRCEECNREHREWFEIAAEKNELRRVEECIRRWIRWGESQ